MPVLCKKKEIAENGNEIIEIREVTWPLGKHEIQHGTNEQKLDVIKNEMSHNNSKEIIGFDIGCKDRGSGEVVDGSIRSLARLDACTATIVDH